ncbi:MAG: hypothetical protein ACKVOQ_20075 [Cyclobacteriaceae bacterium]
MAKKPLNELREFLKPFPEDVCEVTLWLRDFVWAQYPDSNELIYDNYNALVIAFGLSDKAPDVFCGIAVYANYVNFGFLRGSEIPDPDKILNGTGSLYRKLSVKDKKEFPRTAIKKLMKAAYANAQSRLKEKQTLKGKMMVKSVSIKKKRPK